MTWTILGPTDPPEHQLGIRRNSRKWVRARCDCGTEKAVILSTITSGKSKSCGCKSGRRERHAWFVGKFTPTPSWE